jgi:hypothetical protein
MQALGGRIPERVIQAVPNDFVFTSPSIAQLASFVYGVSVGASTTPDDTPYKNVPASILDNKDTIVRLREPVAGEPPLILVHGTCVEGFGLSVDVPIGRRRRFHILICPPADALPNWAVGHSGGARDTAHELCFPNRLLL